MASWVRFLHACVQEMVEELILSGADIVKVGIGMVLVTPRLGTFHLTGMVVVRAWQRLHNPEADWGWGK